MSYRKGRISELKGAGLHQLEGSFPPWVMTTGVWYVVLHSEPNERGLKILCEQLKSK